MDLLSNICMLYWVSTYTKNYALKRFTDSGPTVILTEDKSF